ncbi:MAG TPA: hypothetical protein GX513_09325, partial [Firmicutes bacterium]|nr:hypothetical protein [Bacillota bacterium]
PREGTLREGTPREGTLRDALDSVIRIRATQAFPPSQAVAFVLRLKTLVREEADRHLPGDLPHRRQLAQWEAMVDALTLLAFDTYTQCREKMQEVRINELRNRTYRLLLKANVLADFGIEEAEQLRFGGEPPSAGDAGEGR